MEPALGLPVEQVGQVHGHPFVQPPQAGPGPQRFTRSVSRGHQFTRIHEIFEQGQRAPAFKLITDFPARATAQDNWGNTLCYAKFRSGLGQRHLDIFANSQQVAKMSGGLFWQPTGTFMGRKIKLNGSTTYANYVIEAYQSHMQTESEPLISRRDGLTQVNPGVDPVLGMLLAVCCEELDGKQFRFFIL